MNLTLFPKSAILASLLIFFCASLSASTNFETDNNFNLSEDVCNSNPIIVCPSFVWLKPNESSHPDRTGYAVVQPGGPDCGTPTLDYYDDVEVINLCHIVIRRVWIARDPNNPALFDTCHQMIKQIDEEAPVFDNRPDDITVYATTANCLTEVSWGFPEIYDNVEIDYVTVIGERNGQTFEAENGGFYKEGTTTVTYTIVDKCTNTTTHSFKITVLCASCHIVCPPDACVPVGGDISPSVLGYAQSYSGNMDCGNADISHRDMMRETNCNGAMVYYRVWTAYFDQMPGQAYSCMQRVELKNDSEILLSDCPPDLVVPNNNTPAYWQEPTASNGANTVYMTSNYLPGTTFPVGLTTVTYTATDDCGNEAQCSFKISVLEDTSYPGCPNDIVETCDGNGGAVITWDPPVYNGTCTTCVPGRHIPGFMYVGSFNGSYYYCSATNYNYEDAKAKATKHGGHIVSINSEEENNFVAQYIGSATAMIGLSDWADEGNFVWDSGESVDYENWFYNQPNDKDKKQDVVEIMRSGEWNDVDNDIELEFVMELPCQYVTQLEGPEPGEYLTVGIYTIIYRIADGCGLDQYCEFDVVVEEGMWLTCLQDITVKAASGATTKVVDFEIPDAKSCCVHCPTQINCAEVTQTVGPPSGSAFSIGNTQIVYVATDPCNQRYECSFNVTVERGVGSRTGNETALDGLLNNIDREEENSDIIKLELPSTLSIYPNPVSDNLTIEIPDYKDVNAIQFLSRDGKVINRLSNPKILTQVDISNFNQGVFFVVLDYKSGEQKYERVIKI